MSLVGFSARNHPQQVASDAVDDRRTPRDLFDGINESAHFSLDVAASAENAMCRKYFTREQDGLKQSWADEFVWCNPPYSDIEPWLAKAWYEIRNECHLVVMLLPANRCEQGWWQRHVEPFRDRRGTGLTTRFLAGRLRMPSPHIAVPKKGDRPPFGCVVLTFTKP